MGYILPLKHKVMRTSYYLIDGYNYRFNTLSEVRSHFENYNDVDKKEMDGSAITGYDYNGDETVTRYYHYRKNGKVILSKN